MRVEEKPSQPYKYDRDKTCTQNNLKKRKTKLEPEIYIQLTVSTLKLIDKQLGS